MDHEMEEYGSDSPSEHQVEDAPPQSKRARKISQAQRRKGQRLVGKLSMLINMPLDVFFEIASCLHPLDLLHLARTSKLLRAILLSRSSTSAWKAALSSADSSIPTVPPGLSEPAYAALLFDRICFLCGGERANWVDYAVQLRLCKACYKDNIRKGSIILQSNPRLLSFLLRLVPCEIGNELGEAQNLIDPSSHRLTHRYYLKDVGTVIEETRAYRSVGTPFEDYSKIYIERVRARHKAAFEILKWTKAVRAEKTLADMRAQMNRVNSITAKLLELGYTEDEFPDSEEDPTWHKLVNQPKELTDRIWTNLRPKLEAQIAVERQRQIVNERVERAFNRLCDMIELFEGYIEENMPEEERTLMPNWVDFAKLPSVQALMHRDDAQGNISTAEFTAAVPEMLRDIEQYKAHAKVAIVEHIRQHHPEMQRTLEGVEPADALERYYAYFVCASSDCGRVSYATFAEYHAHWRTDHTDHKWMAEDPEMKEWPRVWLSYSLPQVARGVLCANEIALDTPQRLLNEWVREGRLYCACGDPIMPLPNELDFAKLMEHIIKHDRADKFRDIKRKQTSKPNPNHVLKHTHILEGRECSIKLLPEGADTAPAFVRTTVDEETRAKIQERITARPNAQAGLVCRVCKGVLKKTAGTSDVGLPEDPEKIVWHMQNCHGKEFEKKDILFEIHH
ncbi:hypothetical protein C8Q74DRAFT_1452363 [Fomes fomentarius]|nr:hypothetical protein C8Q74DRAFT_1452363 [Fomes fomentarius]